MAIRKILTEPNKILREKSLRVEKVDKDIQLLMDDMLETLYAAPGIGLAAIQVGVAKRVIVMDVSRDRDRDKESKRNPMYFVNPEITWKSEEKFTMKRVVYRCQINLQKLIALNNVMSNILIIMEILKN